MIHAQNAKAVTFLHVTNAASSATADSVAVDTKGYNYAYFVINNAAATAAGTSTFTSLVFQGGDTTSVTSHTAIATGGTEFTIPTSNTTTTTDPLTGVFGINLEGNGNPRYLSVQYRAPSATYDQVTMTCLLFKPDVSPTTDAGRNVDGSYFG